MSLIVDCTAGAITITGYNVEVEEGVTVFCTVAGAPAGGGGLVINGYNANVEVSIVVSCSVGQLGIQGYNAMVSAPVIPTTYRTIVGSDNSYLNLVGSKL